ncbi:hypothetical protein SLA2020_256450 [Shorea laevis]
MIGGGWLAEGRGGRAVLEKGFGYARWRRLLWYCQRHGRHFFVVSLLWILARLERLEDSRSMVCKVAPHQQQAPEEIWAEMSIYI